MLLSASFAGGIVFSSDQTVFSHPGIAQCLAPGVYFYEGDTQRERVNNGWVVFRDYILLIDANYPDGARALLPKVRATSDKPIRFVFDTHAHSDHAYGNQVWVEQGAVAVANQRALERMRNTETGYYGNAPGAWESVAKRRPDVAASRLSPPTLLFDKTLVFDDGEQRVELLWLGDCHSQGDAFAWLPKQKILFTGDVVGNAPRTHLQGATVDVWLGIWAKLEALGPRVICPGHGPIAGPEIIEIQRRYLLALREEVKRRKDAGDSSDQVIKEAPAIAKKLKSMEGLAPYVPAKLAPSIQWMYADLEHPAVSP